MATVTRLFENRVQTTVGTVYSPGVNAFLFTIKKGDTVAVDLRAEDDAVNEAQGCEVHDLLQRSADGRAGDHLP